MICTMAVSCTLYLRILFLSTLTLSLSFIPPSLPFQAPASSRFSPTSYKMASSTVSYPEYTEEQLKGALDSLMEGSTNPSFDGRHLYGFQDPNSKLSKLQTITATRALDYDRYLVCRDTSQTVENKSQ